MPPIVSIIGRSKSGKTTLIEKLLAELTGRGYLIATIKHTLRNVDLDEPGKDSWRHIKAGSHSTILSCPGKAVLIRPVEEGVTTGELGRMLGEDYDLIITEGFKQGDAPKIEVHRREIGPPLSNIKKLIAIVSDEPLESKVRQFSLEDIKGLADLLEKGMIIPQMERTTLYINNVPAQLSNFPREFITNTLLGMVSSLKGVGKVKSLDIFLKRRK
ncbi:MAG: molybdopterin-guanine dinucleotide biosynthesis protein B [Dehalococcoidales bacterium]|nr:molybdopterin-guanine dinucleotide biosynthesis protein B [Dehalococcoidales bacterium]